MNLYLMRVCEFGTGSEPPLTDKGKRQAAMMAAFLKRQIGRVDIVISGAEVAAIETAEVIAKALGSYVATTTLLKNERDAKPDEIWPELYRLYQQSEDVLVVIDQPTFDPYNDMLLIDGAVAFVRDADLLWLVTPALIESTEALIEAAQQLSEFMEKSTVRHGPDYTYETVPMKRWNLGDGGASGNCEICEDNEAQGWIPEDEPFDSGDMEPEAHPHCTCFLDRAERRRRVYD